MLTTTTSKSSTSWEFRGPYFWPISLGLLGAVRASLSVICLLAYWSFRLLAFLCTCLWGSLWRRLLLAAFVAIGCLYALASVWAELEFMRGLQGSSTPMEAVDHLKKVENFFPAFPRYLRAVANFYTDIHWKGSAPLAIEAIKEGLKKDPLAADLHRALAGYLYEVGDKEGAQREAGAVAQISRNKDVAIRVFQY